MRNQATGSLYPWRKAFIQSLEQCIHHKRIFWSRQQSKLNVQTRNDTDINTDTDTGHENFKNRNTDMATEDTSRV